VPGERRSVNGPADEEYRCTLKSFGMSSTVSISSIKKPHYFCNAEETPESS
jgi:hypothetical protein